jgi:hypothetical protein
MLSGWRKSGQWPWDLHVFLCRFSGFSSSCIEDFDGNLGMSKLLDVFGQLILLAFGLGVLHKSTINSLVGDWINQVQTETVSLEARYNLALYELQRGAVEDMNLRNYSSTILTSPAVRGQLKQKAGEIIKRKIDAESRQSELAEERQQKASADDTSRKTVIDAAFVDCTDAGTFDIDGMCRENATWKSLSLPVLKSAARALVPPRARGNPMPTTKGSLQNTVAPLLRDRVKLKSKGWQNEQKQGLEEQ